MKDLCRQVVPILEGLVRIHKALGPAGDETGEHVELGVGVLKLRNFSPLGAVAFVPSSKADSFYFIYLEPNEGQVCPFSPQGPQNCEEIRPPLLPGF